MLHLKVEIDLLYIMFSLFFNLLNRERLKGLGLTQFKTENITQIVINTKTDQYSSHIKYKETFWTVSRPEKFYFIYC